MRARSNSEQARKRIGRKESRCDGQGDEHDGGRQANSRGSSPLRNSALASFLTSFIAQGTIGVPDGHPSAPNNLTISVELSNSQQTPSSHDSASSTTSATATSSTATGPAATTIWPFREALQKKKPVFIADLKGRAKGFASRGWPELPKNAVVIPIMFEGDTSAIPKAVLIVGLNPRRPWNEGELGGARGTSEGGS